MNDIFDSADEAHVKKEKTIARELRKTSWWKNKVNERVCYHCDQKFSPEELGMDHLVPLARGGKSGKNNLVPSCKACNSKKSYKNLIELRLKKQGVS